jgi:hypothetical protein
LEQSEVEILVNELETRVDRLRSLYDQYFMGIERVPPSVPHKDVDRRVQVLRREQIRNTGLRFRFQMIVQRYNTFQTYWMRICRQIEDGTYKRDVLRAKRKEVERVARESVPPASIDITGDLELEEVADLEALLAEEAETSVKASPVPPAPPAAAAPAPAAKPAALKPPPPAPAKAPATAPKPAPLKLDDLDDFDLVEKPTQIHKPAPGPAASPAPAPKEPAAAKAPSAPLRPAPVAPVAPVAGGAARPVWKKVSAPAAGVSIPIATPNTPILPGTPKPAPTRPEPPAAKPEAPKPPPAAASAAPAKAEAPKPEAPKPAARPRPEPPVRKPLGPNDLSDARVRQIYAEYVRSKRAQNESTASITYENMAKSIRESSEKLRDKHGGRTVDFEVSVKDGKTILKPVVKG